MYKSNTKVKRFSVPTINLYSYKTVKITCNIDVRVLGDHIAHFLLALGVTGLRFVGPEIRPVQSQTFTQKQRVSHLLHFFQTCEFL